MSLPPTGAGSKSGFVNVVDDGVAHALAALALPLPVFVHDAAEFLKITAFQRGLAAQPQLLDVMEILDHLGIAFLALLILFLKDRGG